MNQTDKTKEILENELKTIQENGIQADRKNLKRNMHTQFADPFEFAREYVVNSYDAMATECYISGRETEETVTVTIRDNGKGMDFQRIQDYFKIFRSRKDYPDVKAIGRFGVGKMSVAAVPGLLLFSGITSTGNECWRFETDTLIDDRPVKLEQIEPVPPMGTKFEITIVKTMSLSELLSKIYDILYKYVRHLKIDVYFDLPEVDEEQNPVRRKLAKGIWDYSPKSLGREFIAFINETPAEVVMGIGNCEHELYQNRVFITSKYNLLSFDMGKEIIVPNLMIRINSEIFELTFGRHCLSNETVLLSLVKDIREKVLPEYFDHIINCFNEELIMGSPEIVAKIDEMVVGLLALDPNNEAWSTFPLFNVHGSGRISFRKLSEDILKSGLVYIEASENEGTDYSMFNATVLKQHQPEHGLELVEKVFGQKVINLNLRDTVIEILNNNEIVLSAEEKEFEKYLVFQSKQEVLDRIINKGHKSSGYYSNGNIDLNEQLENNLGICEEARIVERDISSLSWKVNYLVERDGKTSCYSRKFLISGKKIILNLYHPEVRQFVELSSINARLSAHWAMAMCLSDPKLLPHITPDAREDILLIDAMSRINADGDFIPYHESVATERPFLDFLRNCKNKNGKDRFFTS
jgi:Histidine kinase-, DNA gyrase B-, and HSP90-like ATPase